MNNQTISRRLFLQRLLAGGAALGASVMLPRAAWAANVPRTLVNVMLYGGADLRFVFAPDPASANTTYVDQFWQARRVLYGAYNDYASMYAAQYTTVTSGGVSFGIHNSCGWLISRFNAGEAAIIANTYASLNRRHDHSQLIVHSGDLLASRTLVDRDGWGGRMAETIGGNTNVVELSGNVQTFCKGTDPSFRLARVVHAQNTRSMGLPQPSAAGNSSDDDLIHALSAYYSARGVEIETEKPANWPYRKLFQHHASIRAFGDAMAAALAAFPMPASLSGLALNSGSFAQQCRNLYDASLTPDILHYRLLSMSYGGWDTHTNEANRLSANLSDLLGAGGGLATATGEMSAQALNNLVFHFSWDFGRQIAANGSAGTDHGRGSYTILIGKPLTGGVYG